MRVVNSGGRDQLETNMSYLLGVVLILPTFYLESYPSFASLRYLCPQEQVRQQAASVLKVQLR